MTTPRLTSRQSFWLNHYNNCKEQKLTFEKYCRLHDLSAGAFGHARKILIQMGAISEKRPMCKKTTRFVAIKPVPASKASPLAHIILPGNIKIELPLVSIIALLPNLFSGVQHDSAQ